MFARVYDDEEEWFRSIFSNSKKEEAIQNQYEFFVQRMGGPPLFSQRRGHFLFYFILLNEFGSSWF
jgi:truncated hemoglobin YjbI